MSSSRIATLPICGLGIGSAFVAQMCDAETAGGYR